MPSVLGAAGADGAEVGYSVLGTPQLRRGICFLALLVCLSGAKGLDSSRGARPKQLGTGTGNFVTCSVTFRQLRRLLKYHHVPETRSRMPASQAEGGAVPQALPFSCSHREPHLWLGNISQAAAGCARDLTQGLLWRSCEVRLDAV